MKECGHGRMEGDGNRIAFMPPETPKVHIVPQPLSNLLYLIRESQQPEEVGKGSYYPTLHPIHREAEREKLVLRMIQ